MKTFKLSIITQEGEIKEDSSAENPVLGVPGFPALQTQAVNRFLANQRRARAKAKTRGEVVGSGAKIWRQKGTGRARHGDKQAPIFVGGGAAHGPTGTQNYKKKMNQKMVQKAMLSLLSDKFKEKKLFLLENLDFKKTREAFAFLQKVKEKLSVKKEVAFVLSKKDNFGRYLNNLKGVSLLRAESLNPYLLLKTDLLFLTRGALEEMKLHGLTPVVSSPLASAERNPAEAENLRIHPADSAGLLRRRIENRVETTKKGKGTNEH